MRVRRADSRLPYSLLAGHVRRCAERPGNPLVDSAVAVLRQQGTRLVSCVTPRWNVVEAIHDSWPRHPSTPARPSADALHTSRKNRGSEGDMILLPRIEEPRLVRFLKPR